MTGKHPFGPIKRLAVFCAVLVSLSACAASPDDDAEFALPENSRKMANQAQGLSLDTPLGLLMANPQAMAVLIKFDPDLVTSPDVGMAKEFSLRFLSRYSATGLTPDAMINIDLGLKALAPKLGHDARALALSTEARK
jgi:hypothetical protein